MATTTIISFGQPDLSVPGFHIFHTLLEDVRLVGCAERLPDHLKNIDGAMHDNWPWDDSDFVVHLGLLINIVVMHELQTISGVSFHTLQACRECWITITFKTNSEGG